MSLHRPAKIKKKRVNRIWPPPRRDVPYGPSFKQKLAWFEKFPPKMRKKFGHEHDMDIVLFLGGTRSGKTVAAIARCLYIAWKYPGARIIVGSLNFTHLEETVLEDYKRLLSLHKEWDHPTIKRGVNRSHKRIIFRNGSRISFMNLENFMRSLGAEADIVHIEEPELLKTSDALEVLLTRMSGPAVPFKQIILTANPTEDLDWMIEWFRLEQFEEGYGGEPLPIGKPCECHLCVKCQEKRKKNVEFVDGICPKCGYAKQGTCPGHQYFQRVVLCDATDNEHLPENYQRNLAATLSYDKMQRFGKGLVLQRKKGKIYTCFHGGNVYATDKHINPNKDLIWTLDFNQHPQCSAVCQTYRKDGVVHVDVLDEIVLWGAGPEQVADEFINRYKKLGLRKKVKIYGDPTGFNGAIKNLVLSRFHTLVDRLEKAGFDVELMMTKTIYPISLRLDSVNWMMRDGNGYVRLHINPSCRHILLGAEKIEWDNAGKKENENCDIKARSKGKQGELWLLTHPMAALGYYIVKDHPMIPFDEKVDPFIAIPSTGTVITTDKDGNFVERHYTEKELGEIESIYKSDNDEDEEYLDDDEEFGAPPRERSLASALRDAGHWGMR